MTPSKSMPQKSNLDFRGKYPYVCVGTHVSMRIKDGYYDQKKLF